MDFFNDFEGIMWGMETREYRSSIFIINKNNEKIKVDFSKWGAGELNLNLSKINIKKDDSIFIPYLTMETLEQLIVLKRGLVKLYGDSIKLKIIIGYFSYSRQERETEKEPELTSIMLDILDLNFKYDDITILEYHNKESLHKKYNIKNRSILKEISEEYITSQDNVYIVAPDKGAKKRNDSIGIHTDIVIDKVRKDGQVTSKIGCIKRDIVENAKFIILDDICDGGRTFANIAELLKASYPNSNITLCVSHCIIPYGTQLLEEKGVDNIITSDTCMNSYFNEYIKIKQIK